MLNHYYSCTAYKTIPTSLVNYLFQPQNDFNYFTLQIGVQTKIMANILSFHAYSSKSIYFFYSFTA